MKHLLALPAVISMLWLQAQNNSINWIVDVQPQKVFIENQSQFDGLNQQSGSKILFATEKNGNQVFFTKTGLTFRIEKAERPDENEREDRLKEEALLAKKIAAGRWTQKDQEEREEREKREKQLKWKVDVVHMQWENANPAVEVIGEEATSFYYTYTVGEKNIDHAKAFKKLLYKNIYPGIDAEYYVPEEGGIKYTLILHPGADASVIKMKYSDTKSVSIDGEGNVRLASDFGDIIDHAPITTYEYADNATIPSGFSRDGKTISFNLGSYNHSSKVIIDPWTVAPAMPTLNKVWDVNLDSVGNVYVYGGTNPMKLIKYNTAGTLVWTYNTPWTIGASTPDVWTGTSIADPAGQCYVTAGSTAAMHKVNTAGGVMWTAGSSFGGTDEYWTLGFNCDYTKLITGGTKAFSGQAMEINMSNGAQGTNLQVAGSVGINPNEIRSMTAGPDGNFYYLVLYGLGSFKSNMTLNWSDTTSDNFNYGGADYGNPTNMGFHAIAASANALYTMNGSILRKRNILNGTVLTSITIPNGVTSSGFGGVNPKNGGLAVDSCGNVYVGSSNGVYKYDANLNFISSVTTPGEVYDLKITQGGRVIAGGNGFVADLNMTACPTIKAICYTVLLANAAKTEPQCFGLCTGTATADGVNGSPPFTYLWSNGQTTKTINNLCAGTYTVTVTDAASSTATSSVIVGQPTQVAASVTSSPASCGNANGSATAVGSGGSGPYSFVWSNSGNTATINNLQPGTYNVTVTGQNGCTNTNSVLVGSSSLITLTPSVTNASCGSTGSATITPTGGTAPYTYAWSNGQTTQTATNLSAGNYTVTVTSSSGGSAGTFYTEDFTAGANGWTINLNGPGTNGPQANQWVINNDNNCTCHTTNYLHITCSGLPCLGNPGICEYETEGAFFQSAATDKFSSSPDISTMGRSNMTLTFNYLCNGEAGGDYGLVRFSSDGGTTWTDMPTQYSGVNTCTPASVSIPATYENRTNFRVGFRWINNNNNVGSNPGFTIDSIRIAAAAGSNCPAVAQVTVTSSNGITLAASSTNASCTGNTGSATVNVTAGTGPYTYLWSNSSNTQTISNIGSGTYTVTVTGAGGCSATASANVTATNGINMTATSVNASCGNNNGSATATVNTGTGPYTYLWSNNGNTATINNLSGGTYQVTVTGSGGCSATASVTVTANPGLSLATTSTAAGCGATNGSATVNVNAGSGPFTYLWSNNGTTATINNISGGSYTVTVTGSGGCSASATVSVGSSGGLTLTPTATATSCGNSNGSATASITAGTGPFTYLWSNNGSTQTISSLVGGTYFVTVLGAGGCSVTASINVPSSTALTASFNVTAPSCGNNNGNITCAGILNGTAPINVQWTKDGSPAGTGLALQNIGGGTYVFLATDANGCTFDSTFVFVTSGGTATITMDKNNICSGDSSLICAPAGFSHYQWNTGDTTMCIKAKFAGNYWVTVTDAGNCTVSSNHLGLNVLPLPPVSITVSGDTLTSYNAVTYQWYLNGTPIPNANASTYIATQPGQYSVLITDTNGCGAISNRVDMIGTAIADLQQEGITIYPNPTEQNWLMEVDEALVGSRYELFDARGRLVFKAQIRNTKSEIGFTPARGVYVIQITTKSKTLSQKLIRL